MMVEQGACARTERIATLDAQPCRWANSPFYASPLAVLPGDERGREHRVAIALVGVAGDGSRLHIREARQVRELDGAAVLPGEPGVVGQRRFERGGGVLQGGDARVEEFADADGGIVGPLDTDVDEAQVRGELRMDVSVYVQVA